MVTREQVMRGPRIETVVRNPRGTFVVVEPLRFLPVRRNEALHRDEVRANA